MIFDSLAKLGASQAFTEADEKTTFSYDTGNPTIKNRIGSGIPMCVVFVITTAAAGDSASLTDTFDFCAVEDTQASLASSTVMEQRRVAASLLVAGAIVAVDIPVGRNTKRYIGGQVVIGASDTLNASSYIVPKSFVQDFLAYTKGYSV